MVTMVAFPRLCLRAGWQNATLVPRNYLLNLIFSGCGRSREENNIRGLGLLVYIILSRPYRAAKLSLLNFSSQSMISIIQTGYHQHHRWRHRTVPSSGLTMGFCKRNPDAIAIMTLSRANFRSLWSTSLKSVSDSHQKHVFYAEKQQIN